MNPQSVPAGKQFLNSILRLYEEAAQYLDLKNKSQTLYASLKRPERVLHCPRIAVRLDNGWEMMFEGWRAQHCTWRGPAKGGIRMHVDCDVDEVAALSMLMTWKVSVVDLYLGGGKGAIAPCWDLLSEEEANWMRKNFPTKLSKQERRAIISGYVDKIKPLIGPDVDVPAPDINTGSEEMAWLMNRYGTLVGYTVPAVVTGKPLSLGGIDGRKEATGFGCAMAIFRAKKYLSSFHADCTKAIVQGFGNVGSEVARILAERSILVVAVSDKDGAIFNENGLDIKAMISERSAHPRSSEWSVAHFSGGQKIVGDEIFDLKADIFVPAAMESVITESVAKRLNVQIVAEGANGPTTPEGDKVLNERGIFVIPDILANAGGVIVSQFEIQQNKSDSRWSRDQVERQLTEKMDRSFGDVVNMAKKYNVSNRTAAYILAVDRVAQAGFDRGKNL